MSNVRARQQQKRGRLPTARSLRSLKCLTALTLCGRRFHGGGPAAFLPCEWSSQRFAVRRYLSRQTDHRIDEAAMFAMKKVRLAVVKGEGREHCYK